MKISILYNNINYSVTVDDDITRGGAETVFKRLMMSVGFHYNDEDAQDIILDSNKILGVDNE